MRTFTQKLAFLLMVLWCCAGVSLQAEEVTIGDESSTSTATYYPAYSYYNYSFNQQIYTAEEVGSAGTISSISLWLSNGSSADITRSIEIYMVEVDRNAFSSASDWEALSEDNLVYSGEVTFPVAETKVTFDLENPFSYGGTDNLLIAFRDVTGSYSGTSSTCTKAKTSPTANGEYATLYAYRDNPGAYDIADPDVTGTRQTSRNVISLEITAGGGGPVCEKPESVEVTGITAHEAVVNWIGGSGTYNVEYKGGRATDWTFAVKNTNLTSYTLSNLEANTSYQVRVHSVCGETTSGNRSSSFNTAIGLPFTENFNSSSLPSGWSQYAGLLNADGSVAFSAGSWTFGTGNGVFDSHARFNVYSNNQRWLITPAIPMEEGHQLTFNVALTAYSGTLASPQTNGVDDRFLVLVSLDGGTNWITLREWNNSGSEYVYNEIACSADGDEVEIDLSNYNGQTIQIAFYGESTLSNADNNIHIDNVKIAPIPLCRKVSELREDEASKTKTSVTILWTPLSDEQNWKLQYKKGSASEWNTLDMTTNSCVISGLETFTNYQVQVAALCDPADPSSLTDYCKPITVKTAAGVPFAESFNVPSLPAEWKRYAALWEEVENGEPLEAVSDGWKILSSANANNVFPDSTSHLVLNIAGDACKHWIVSPVVEMEDGYQLSFDLALTKRSASQPTAAAGGGQNDDKFIVAISQDGGASWEALRQWENPQFSEINHTAQGQSIKLPIDAKYSGKGIRIAFYGESTAENGDNNLHISNLKIATIPNCENSSRLDITGISGTYATADWDYVQDAEWQYLCVANPVEGFVPSDDNFISISGRSIDLGNLLENTEYMFYLRKKCDDVYSDIISRAFTTIQTPVVLDSEHSFSDDFESGNKWRLINEGQENAWVYGTATNNGGSHALYISNDNGLNHTYTGTTSSYSFATKTFSITQTGVYTFSYDWKNNGGSSAYLRVALAPVNAVLAAGSSPNTSEWKNLNNTSSLYGASGWQQESFELAVDEAGDYLVVLYWYNYGYSYSSTNNPPAAIDNFRISRLACPKATGLSISELGANTASLSWDSDNEGFGFEYAYAPASESEPDEYISIAENAIDLTGLDEQTTYKFYLRKVCGEFLSEVITINFTTTQTPAEIGNAFEDDFEDGIKWVLENGDCANQWVLGSATNNGGSHSLYVSNDGGASNKYSNTQSSLVYATKLFHFEDGDYIFSYDWKAYGESNYDLMYVALVSAETPISASTSVSGTFSSLPTGWTALHDGVKLNLDSAWNHVSKELSSIADGEYKVVIAWRNDNSTGSNPPAAVDNFRISKVLCRTPDGLQVIADSTSNHSAVLTWTPKDSESNWLVRCRKAGTEDWGNPYMADKDTIKLEYLEASSMYEAQVAALCDPSDMESISEYSASITFASGCDAISSLSENFDGITEIPSNANKLPVCWSFINTNTSSSHNYYPTILESATFAHSGSNSLYFHSSAYASSNGPENQYAVLPEMTSVSDKRIKFYARPFSSGSNDPCFAVGVMTDPADTSTFVPVYTRCGYLAEYAPFVIPLDSYTGEGKFIAIKLDVAAQGGDYTHGLYIDDVVVEDIPSCLEPGGLTAALTQGNGSVATLSWTAGADETAWVVEYSVNADFSDALSANASENPSLDLSGLTPETTYYARVKAVCNESDESPWSDPVSFKPTNVFSLLVNDGTVTSERVPVYGNWADDYSRSQFIIPAADLASIQWGTINELTFYSGNADKEWGNAQFEVYMAEASDTTISALENWSSLTKVMNSASLSIVNGLMVVTLDNPYLYEGGNLLIGINQVISGTYSACSWYGVTATGSSQGGYGTSISQQNFLPKMQIGYTPGEAPSCIKPTALAVALTNGNGSVASLSWAAGGDEAAWVVEYSRNADFSDALSLNVSGAPAADLSGLTAEVTYYARVKAVCGENMESEYCSAVSFRPTNAVSLTINRGTATNGYIPVYGYYADYGTHTQFIVPADSLASIQWGIINQLTFYASNTSINWAPAQFEVYMAEVEASTVTALADWSSMEKVMNSGSLAIAGGEMVVSFDAPYQYMGGNLLIGVHQVANGEDYSCSWYGVAASGAAYEAHGSSMTSSTQNFLPKMKIDYVPGSEPTCHKPTGLAISNITSSGGKASWDAAENGSWQYAIVLEGEGEPSDNDYINADSSSVEFGNLAQLSNYIFYLRRNCGEADGYSMAISAKFTTLQEPVYAPYSDDYESGNAWRYINGACTNAWAYGEAVNNGGSHAMYISKDNGATYSYEGYASGSYSMVYAEKLFIFEGGNYIFNYDWKAEGYVSYSTITDYLRVALVPANVELEASSSSYSYAPSGFGTSSLPSGWIALDGGSALYGSSAWQTKYTDEMYIPAGMYKVVFAWRNGTSNYNGSDPAAIDNFSIERVACAQPTAVAIPASSITSTSAQISWTADEGQNQWQIAIDSIGSFNPDSVSGYIIASVNPYEVSGLSPEHSYYVYVRAICEEDSHSQWSRMASFRTASACQTPDGLALVDAGLNSAVISWNTYGQSDFNLRYSQDGVNWTTVSNVNSPLTIDGLEPSTSYRIQAQAVCQEEDTWSSALTFKTAYGTPFEEKFSTTSIPADWKLYSGLLSDVLNGSELTSATSGWSFGSYNGIFGGNHAYMNIYSADRKYWLASPAITLSEDVQLSFDMALTKYSGTLQPVDSAQQQDDKFVVLISTDNGASWSILRQWDNAGSEYIFDSIACSAEGEQVAVNLSNYTGQNVIIAFYGESTVSGGDNNLHITNVLIDKIPSCLKPSRLRVSSISAHTASLSWKAGSGDQSAWQIAIDTVAFNPDQFSEDNLINVSDSVYTISGLQASHSYYVAVRANCGDEDGVSRWSDVVSFRTTIACPVPSNLRAILTPGNGSVATLNWKENGVAQEWRIEYSESADMSDAIAVTAFDTIAVLSNLTPEMKYYARVIAVCGDEDGESASSAVISFTPTDNYQLLINDGTTTNDRVPVYGNWVDNYSRSQFIIPASSLSAIEWDSIQSLTFFASTANAPWTNAEFEVYVAEVEDATLSALYDWNDLIKVVNSASLSIESNEMKVIFDTPYQYEGGNLLIGINQTVSGTYKASSWYGISAPNAAYGGYGTGSTLSSQNFLPKMLISYVPGAEPACKKPTGVIISDITAFSAKAHWNFELGASWQYALLPASSSAPSDADYLSASNDTIELNDLREAESYIFYLRRDCGNDGYSDVVSVPFSTVENIASLPFSDDFETTDGGWKLINGNETNAWVIGDAVSSTGLGALYISNDGGISNSYTKDAPSIVYASKKFVFELDTMYVFKFDWKVNGEVDPDDGPLDYLRIGILPASIPLVAGNALPIEWYDLGDAGMAESNSWLSTSVTIHYTPGIYNIAFAWVNDESEGEDAPAAIDNFSVYVQGSGTVGIDAVNASDNSKAVKLIRNQQMFILLNGVIYDITGRKVDTF